MGFTSDSFGSSKPPVIKTLQEKVAQGNVASSLESKIYAALHKLFFPFLQGEVEFVELAFPNALGQGQEELL